MKRFKSHTLQVLVATDVAARGIDVNDLTHVIHYALPDDPFYYTHRSGRTARAGKKGISLSILTNRDMRKLDELKKTLKLKIDKISIPSLEEILDIRLNKWATNLLNSPIRKDLNGKLLTDIQMLLGSLSYEELVEKLVSKEIDTLNYNKKGKNLNESERASKRSYRGDSFIAINDGSTINNIQVATPNFCSSSMINNPKSLKLTSFPTILCVPIKISISPSATPFKVSFCSLEVLNRLI